MFDHLEGAVLQCLGSELGDPRLSFGLERQSQQRTDVGVKLLGAVAVQRLERAPKRHPDAQVRLVQADAQPAADQVAKRSRMAATRHS